MVTYVNSAFLTEPLSHSHLETHLVLAVNKKSCLNFCDIQLFLLPQTSTTSFPVQTTNMLDQFCHTEEMMSNVFPHNSLTNIRTQAIQVNKNVSNDRS